MIGNALNLDSILQFKEIFDIDVERMVRFFNSPTINPESLKRLYKKTCVDIFE